MKILNLYSGIGGNRKLWGDEHKITAVEQDTAIANPDIKTESRKHDGTIKELGERKGFNPKKLSGIDKRLVLRNCVEPKVGKQILDFALKSKTLI